jgi:prepilin-type N-terminal cleavage/methylation domain-containing protein
MKRFNLTSVSNNRGFTLIEILIAITIMAFMTMGVVSITENAADTMDRTTVLNKNNLQVETALSRFEWDFSQIYSPMYFSSILNLSSGNQDGGTTNDRDGDGKDDDTGKPVTPAAQISPELRAYYQVLIQRFEQNQHFTSVSREGLPIPKFYSPEKTVFEFFTSSNRRKMENTKQSHFGWVRYALGDALPKDPDEEPIPNLPQGLKTLVRYYSVDDPYGDKRIDPEDAEHVKAAVLLENVEKMEFEFWDMNRKKWETSLTSIAGGDSMLRGVRLSLTWYDSTGFKRTASRIYRNHWPLEVPQDVPAQAPATTAGASAGTNTGNTDSGDDGGSN